MVWTASSGGVSMQNKAQAFYRHVRISATTSRGDVCRLVTSDVLRGVQDERHQISFPCRRENQTQQHSTVVLSDGLLVCQVMTPGVAISCNENADSSVRSDLSNALHRLLSEKRQAPSSSTQLTEFCKPTSSPHSNVSSCSAAAFTDPILCLPISASGRVCFGTWQGIYLIDGRQQPKESVSLLCVALPAVSRITGTVHIPKRGGIDATDQIMAAVRNSAVRGLPGVLLSIWTQHTSSSLMLVPVASSDCSDDCLTGYCRNTEAELSALVPNKWSREGFFKHVMEGDDDMPAHVKTTLVGTHAALPLLSGDGRADSPNASDQWTSGVLGPPSSGATGAGSRGETGTRWTAPSREENAYGDGMASDDLLMTKGQLRLCLLEHRDCGGWGGGHTRSWVGSIIAPSEDTPLYACLSLHVEATAGSPSLDRINPLVRKSRTASGEVMDSLLRACQIGVLSVVCVEGPADLCLAARHLGAEGQLNAAMSCISGTFAKAAIFSKSLLVPVVEGRLGAVERVDCSSSAATVTNTNTASKETMRASNEDRFQSSDDHQSSSDAAELCLYMHSATAESSVRLLITLVGTGRGH